MYFGLTKRKFLNAIISLAAFVVAVLLTLSFNSRFSVGEASALYLRSVKEDVDFWFSTRVFNRDKVSSMVYPASRGAARSIPILVYHGLPDEGGVDNPFNSLKFFEHMKALKAAGWETVTLREFEKFIRGEGGLPEKSFLLTFDDGRKDTFYPSDPALKDLGYEAVMFAITKKSLSPTEEQSPYYLSPFELEAMEKSDRWEVESHGRDSHDWYYVNDKGAVGHFFSNLLWLEREGRLETEDEFRDRVIYDLSHSRSDLESALDKEVRFLAYPFGDYGQDGSNYEKAIPIVRANAEKVYKMAFYQVWKGNTESFNYPSDEEFMMKRIEPLGNWSGDYLLALLESGLSKDLPYSSSTFGEEWVSSWGKITKGEEMVFEADEISTGAGAGLNGSWWWRDYTFTTDVDWSSGSNVVLVARMDDDENYFGCNFGANKTYVKSVKDGVSTNVREASYSLPSEGSLNLGVRARGSNIECLVNGQVVLLGNGVNYRSLQGGIGLEIWDGRKGVAQVSFDNIKVEALE
jgi:peptidoglycan/xylan/chitin deacetylase (PgdA/CDA1 family)